MGSADESGTFFYFLLSFEALVVIPCTYYLWPRDSLKEELDRDKTICHCDHCRMRNSRLRSKDPWRKAKQRFIKLLFFIGWTAMFLTAYEVAHLQHGYSQIIPVLGLYGFLFFMVALPVAVVIIWWYQPVKCGDEVLLDTTQLYYYLLHKTPHMVLERVIMVLGVSFEFEKSHNSEIIERPSDNIEVPQLIKELPPNFEGGNREKYLCYAYSIKARALVFAHLSRMKLSATLEEDKLYVVKKCPYLLQNFIKSSAELTMLALAGRGAVRHAPHLDTIENAMKLCPLIVQALWDYLSPLLQLPHVTGDMLRHFQTRKGNIISIRNLACMKSDERRAMLSSLNDDQYDDVMNVISKMPLINVEVKSEVFGDEDSYCAISPSAIVIVTAKLTRKHMNTLFGQDLSTETGTFEEPEDCEKTEEKSKESKGNSADNSGETGSSHSVSDSRARFYDEDGMQNDDAEWGQFQPKVAKSKISHSVHSPLFPEDKQEHWWIYLADKKEHVLVSFPYLMTNLVEEEEVELQFTAPKKPGLYKYSLIVRSDSYIGFNIMKTIKVYVKQA